ncbi:MAG: hypothetical protein ABIO40_04990 [Devosia sp.]
MGKFIAVTGKGDKGTMLINFDHVARINAQDVKGKSGAELTFADGDTLTVQEDLEALGQMLKVTAKSRPAWSA